jgi:hypothetical protein
MKRVSLTPTDQKPANTDDLSLSETFGLEGVVGVVETQDWNERKPVRKNPEVIAA